MAETSTVQVKKVVKAKVTTRARKLAKEFMDNLGSNRGTTTQQLMLRAGYAPASAKAQTPILRGAGFIQAMAELGLTQELVTSSLVTDILEKPQHRAFELSIAAKILGLDRRVDDTPSQTMAIQNAIIVIQPPKE